MSKICIINQPAGLGDILFCQKIAHVALQEFGCDKVVWPVSEVYNYLHEYISQPNVFFEPKTQETNLGKSIINTEELLYIPLVSSDIVTSHTDMRAHGHIKYKFFFNTDYHDWKNYFSLNRNLERESKLIEFLKLEDNEPFNLINRNFGTPPNFKTNDHINPLNGLKNIYMDIVPGFNIFDWIRVIEKAKEIHTMETSLYYILEKLGIEENVYIYSKYTSQYGQKDDYEYMKSHCSKNWNYV